MRNQAYVFNHISQANDTDMEVQPNQRIGPLSLKYIDAIKIPISLCLNITKACFSDKTTSNNETC